ncbi:NAD-dependent epimerase/dehydratase family protein [Glycomyces albidus]|jgi:nucleoside-diphosphate-sugar epimerase|uniref:NAD-dependent epimerase/dehydratase family protein n=1 Tax=Glycomyces albidus TaxID=2656774 RepID=A0A6L5GD09_9ACTN|nr:NAD-dependent epimerase/dehydratase family protein [Glycomyces albidus]MQM27587.1 NAD-dependent epimerase/dehydratase family protein [Glycomyces albidus]
MAERVIIGRGAVAVATARRLAASGDRVRMVSRSGGGPDGVERIALDATDTPALIEAVQGADTVVNAAMTAYHTWPELMPPLFDSILTAAEKAGADYVMLGNHYGYRPTSPVSERTPMEPVTRKGKVRAELWRRAKAAHDEGRLRVTELRAGQFLGPGAYSPFNLMVEPNVLRGELALVDGNPDAQHSFTYTEDAAAALVALARSETAWGRAWHAPVLTATVREVATRLAELRGAPEPRLAELTEREAALLAFTDPLWSEFAEMAYMSSRPYIVDDGDIRDAFGIGASPLDTALGA